MFGFIDTFKEITSAISKNKLRTFLTGMAVAWGIFLLIILLAAGKGLENGVRSNFSGRAQNAVYLYAGETSMPFRGMSSERTIKLDSKDYNLIKSLPESGYVSPTINNSRTFSFNENYGNWSMRAVMPDFDKIENIKILKGRFISEKDIEENRKVIVISEEMRDVLFKKENPIGKIINADGILFRVIGIYTIDKAWGNPPSYIPLSTAKLLFNPDSYNSIMFTINGVHGAEQNEAFSNKLREKLSQLHVFDKNDLSALYIRNTAKDADQANAIFNAIKLFIWIIGISSLMAGIVGVGNIMVVTVKERTKEIGIRKAIGAKPLSILRIILSESIIITTVAGYAGILLGVLVVTIVNTMIENSGGENSRIFQDPSVDIFVVLESTAVLIIAGTLAGLIPALRATKVSPIEAMRAD